MFIPQGIKSARLTEALDLMFRSANEIAITVARQQEVNILVQLAQAKVEHLLLDVIVLIIA